MGFLRFILALTVVFSHAGAELLVGSRNAVQLFYVVSGFLISYILNLNPVYSKTFVFFKSRVLRLFPLYFVVAAFSLFFPVYGNDFYVLWSKIPFSASSALILSNLFIFGQDLILFCGVKDGVFSFTGSFLDSDVLLFQGLLVPQAWSLAVELSFYVIAPFVVRKPLLVVCVFLCAVLLRLLSLNLGFGDTGPWTYRFFPFELALFMLGAISYHYLFPLWRGLDKASGFFSFAAVMILVLCFIGYFSIDVEAWKKSVVLFFVFALLLPGAFCFQSRCGVDKYIGELSYPLYIGHLLVISIASVYAPRYGFSGSKFMILVVFCSIVFSVILKYFIADRIELFRAKIAGRG